MHVRASLSNSVTGVDIYERQIRENIISWELKQERSKILTCWERGWPFPFLLHDTFCFFSRGHL